MVKLSFEEKPIYDTYLHIIAQGAYSEGSLYGHPQFYHFLRLPKKNIIAVKSSHGKREDPQDSEWHTTEYVPDEAAFQRFAQMLTSEKRMFISNRRENIHPLTYKMDYYISGEIGRIAINLKIEHVMQPQHQDEVDPLVDCLMQVLLGPNNRENSQ